MGVVIALEAFTYKMRAHLNHGPTCSYNAVVQVRRGYNSVEFGGKNR
jgi:hypothetical protein